jgi:hypothetical protein
VAGQSAGQLMAMSTNIRNGQGWPAAMHGLLGAPSDQAITTALKRWGPAQ